MLKVLSWVASCVVAQPRGWCCGGAQVHVCEPSVRGVCAPAPWSGGVRRALGAAPLSCRGCWLTLLFRGLPRGGGGGQFNGGYNRGFAGNGFGSGYYRSPFSMWFSPFDLFYYWSPRYPARQRERAERGEGLNFLESIFSFGAPRPPAE